MFYHSKVLNTLLKTPLANVESAYGRKTWMLEYNNLHIQQYVESIRWCQAQSVWEKATILSLSVRN